MIRGREKSTDHRGAESAMERRGGLKKKRRERKKKKKNTSLVAFLCIAKVLMKINPRNN
jgi:hypothetical protein